MADQIGEAVVKITGDIKPLQEAVKKAEKAVGELQSKSLEGFKINYMGEQTFETFEEYTTAIERQNQEWERYVDTQREVADAAEDTAEALTELKQTSEEATTTVTSSTTVGARQTHETLNTLKTAFSDLSGTVEGFAQRIKNAFERKLSTDRGILAATVAATAAFKKCMDATREFDKTMDESMTRIENAFEKIKASIGRLVEPIVTLLTPAIEALGTALDTLTTPLKWVSDGIDGLFKIISSNLGFGDGFETVVVESSDVSEELNEMANSAYRASEAYKEMNDSIAKANKSLADARYDYEQSLKKVLVSHEATVQKLTDQIKDANEDYIQAVNERNAAFMVSQAKEEEAHQKKVDELMTQLNFLQRYNNKYNQEKLEAVKFALAREETLYKKRTEAERAELELQNEYDRKRRDERLASYESELNDEREFLNKHAQAFKEVRNVILDDEVDILQKRYQEMVNSYAKEIATAQKAYDVILAKSKSTVSQAAQDYLDKWGNVIDKVTEKTIKAAEKQRQYGWAISPTTGTPFVGSVATSQYMAYQTLLWEKENGYASGGFTGRGGENEVAGIVHKGEYVLPQEMVDQSTGTPKLSGNVTINISGTFATSDLERRKVAQQIVDALNQTNYARLGV